MTLRCYGEDSGILIFEISQIEINKIGLKYIKTKI